MDAFGVVRKLLKVGMALIFSPKLSVHKGSAVISILLTHAILTSPASAATVVVRDAAGVIQSPYYEEVTAGPMYYTAQGVADYLAISMVGFCDMNPAYIKDGYSMTGNGCEMVYDDGVVANTPPSALDDSQGAIEGMASTFDPRVNDADAEGDLLSITAVTQGVNGTVTFTSTSVTYSPTAGWSGTDSFSYTISDGNGGSDTATVTMSVVTARSEFEYDDLGRLTRASHPNGLVVQYSYDAAGNRTAKTTSAIETFFSISDASVFEGALASFTVTRSGVISNVDEIHYFSSDVTAAGGDDYSTVSGVLTFAANVTTQTIDVPTTDDSSLELDETFKVTLFNPQPGVGITTAEGVGTILNNDAGPQFTISTASGVEPENFALYEEMVFTVTLSPESGFAHSVDYATANGTAANGQDYTAVSETLAFAPGETSKTFSVPILDDYSSALYEGDETVIATLTNATGGATVSGGPGVGTITDFDLPPVIDVSMTATGSEPNSVYILTATMSTASSFTHSVDYSKTGGTATAGVDFDVVSGTFTFVPGDVPEFKVINVLDDSVWEGSETFTMSLSNPTGPGATIGVASASAVLNDDEIEPTVRISSPYITIDDTADEGQNIVLPVTLSGASGLTHTFDYVTRDATAYAGVDYVAADTTITFNPGETIKNISIPTINNSNFEWFRTFYVDLTNTTDSIVVTDSQAVAVINDNDPGPVFSIGDASAPESGSLYFTITKTGSTPLSHSVTYATAAGTADSTDFFTETDIVSFLPSETSKIIGITTKADVDYEADETMFVNLSSPSLRATILDGQGTGTILNDDTVNAPPVAVNDSYSMPPTATATFYVLSNDSDRENDPMTITSITQTWLGTATINAGGGSINFAANASPDDSGFFTYTISDGQGNSDTATVAITILSGGGGGGNQ